MIRTFKQFVVIAPVATVFGLAALGLVLVIGRSVSKAYGAPNVPSSTKQSAEVQGFYPDLLQDFNILGPKVTRTPFFGVPMVYGGGLNTIYPQLRPHDVIPLLRIRLTLPAGVRIIQSRFNIAPPCKDGKYQLYPCSWVPPSNRRWQMVGGKPTWTWRGARMTVRVVWDFRLNVPGDDHVACIKAEAQAFYLLKGKMKPIPHAPVEYAQTAACTAPPSTTTTTVTTTSP